MKITLYHFTCAFHLPSINEDGLAIGDVHLTFGGREKLGTRGGPDPIHPWFTDNPSWEAQRYLNVANLKGADVDKTGVRITVELDTDDPKLVPWSKLRDTRLAEITDPKEKKKYEAWFKTLENNQAHHWYVYCGVVTPDKFKAIDRNPHLKPTARGTALITTQWPIPEIGVSRERVHKVIIDFYLTMIKECLRVEEFDILGNQGMTIREEKEALSYLYEALHNSRIFEFTARDYHTLFHTADVYTTEHVYGERWEPATREQEESGHVPLTDEEYKEFTEDSPKFTEAVKAMPMPTPLPFPNTYIAWGGGARLSPAKFTIQTRKLLEPDVGGWAMAMLLTERGYVYSFMVYARVISGDALVKHLRSLPTDKLARLGEAVGNNDVDEIWTDPTFRVGIERTPQRGWIVPTSMASWMANLAIDAINQCDRLVAERPLLSTKMRLRDVYREIRKAAPPPPPYYKILLKPETFDARVNALFTRQRHVEWSHQWDVRAHDLIKIMRGTLPIEPKLYHKLLKRKYDLFDALHPVSAECMAAMMKRNLPPMQPGEWLAYHKGRVKSYVKGPEDKPYIPSSRALKDRIPETIKSA